MALAACVLAYFTMSLPLRPLEVLLDGIALFARGRFNHRISGSSAREFNLVAERRNGMGELPAGRRFRDDP